ncbi:hypothetical protein CC80DRAFT_497863 [Byssothecium circinans]|uniref:Rhodopsin domain-containing protein n=1 Tax=Byssothecium circinans TaxID=147558 RepID=A0A6A5T7M7_9PLEO|nr:hypothetical protein CC80DRAFT_497863 [Byssothecium circinans]
MDFSNIPVMPPPKGMKSNFDNPATNATSTLIVNWIFTPLALIATLIRLYTRTTLSRDQRLGWDDALVSVGMAGSIAHAVLVTVALSFGYGRHLWDIRVLSLSTHRLHIMTSFEEAYITAVFMIKISILLLYRRLFGVYDSSRRLINVGIIFVATVSMPAIGVAIARSVKCASPKALTIDICHTKNVFTVVTVFGVCNTLTDFYTLLIPVNRVIKLNIGSRKKLGLLAIFLGGFAACIMSLVRLIIIVKTFDSPDGFFNGAKVTPFTIVEMNLGIICSCMTLMPGFIKQGKHAFATLISSRSGTESNWLGLKDMSRTKIGPGSKSKTEEVNVPGRSVPELPSFLGHLPPSPQVTRLESDEHLV